MIYYKNNFNFKINRKKYSLLINMNALKSINKSIFSLGRVFSLETKTRILKVLSKQDQDFGLDTIAAHNEVIRGDNR